MIYRTNFVFALILSLSTHILQNEGKCTKGKNYIWQKSKEEKSKVQLINELSTLTIQLINELFEIKGMINQLTLFSWILFSQGFPLGAFPFIPWNMRTDQ